jgi:hypothetical protein
MLFVGKFFRLTQLRVASVRDNNFACCKLTVDRREIVAINDNLLKHEYVILRVQHALVVILVIVSGWFANFSKKYIDFLYNINYISSS